MAGVAAKRLGSRVREGLVVSHIPARAPQTYEAIVGGHPVPTAASERAGHRALRMAESTAPDETLLVLLSGGASALMAVPAEGVTLEDKRATTERLLRAGADIQALNTVRKHLSAIKGGWLAARSGGRCLAYAISDVVGDDMGTIGSGPTVADRTTHADALDVLQRFGGLAGYPPAVVARLERGVAGDAAETPMPGDSRLAQAETIVIGGRGDAMTGSVAEARRLGYRAVRLEDAVVGEASVAAARHLDRVAPTIANRSGPTCIVSTGETTVTLTGKGKGGRNQEFALAAVRALALGPGSVAMGSESPALFMLASLGTDGVDGPTDAAGAIVDLTTLDRARALGLAAPQQFLDDNNAYAFFAALGDLIHTGPTDTNVGDLQVILVA